jgi:1-acyl-sn-glycerol-3-phosphate acyltransferase
MLVQQWVAALFFVPALLTVTALLNLAQLLIRDRRTRQTIAGYFWRATHATAEGISATATAFYGDQLPNHTQSMIIIGNHQGGLDFLAGMAMVSRVQSHGGNLVMMMKKSLKWVPWIGWTHYFQGSLFLARNWETDQKALHNKFKEMASDLFPKPYLIGVYPEGTRPTKKKLEEAKKFAESRGLPVLQNVLLPRPKGFLFVMKNVRNTCKYLIDATIAYEDKPCFLKDLLFTGRFSTKCIHIHTRVIKISDMPTDPQELEKWLYNSFSEKDKLMAHYKEKNCFPGKKFYTPLDVSRFVRVILGYELAFSFLLGLVFGWQYALLGLLLTANSVLSFYDGFRQSAQKSKALVEAQPIDVSRLLHEEENMSKTLNRLSSKLKE